MTRKLPDWVEWKMIIGPMEGEESLLNLLHEVYDATQNGLHQLVLMGIRAIIERVIISKVGDRGSFSANLEAFKETDHISLLQFDALNTILEMGHAVIHRGFVPTEYELKRALDIMEGVLAPIYDRQEVSEQLSERIPARSIKPKPSKPEILP